MIKNPLHTDTPYDVETAQRKRRLHCPFCGSAGKSDPRATLFLGLKQVTSPFEIKRCRACQFRWLDPVPTGEETEKLYTGTGYFERPEDGYSYSTDTRNLHPCLVAQAEQFRRYLGDGKHILDVGCATGDFLEIAASKNFSASGVEISKYAYDKAKAKGLSVLHGDLSTADLSKTPYHGLRMSHVLEHLPDPTAALMRVHQLLIPKGILYVEVPLQFDGALDVYAALRGSHQPYGLFSLHHLSFFTPSSLVTLLKNTGFDVVALSTFCACRRRGRKPSMRLRILQSLLWLADKTIKRGDVISVWARRKNN